MTPKYAIGQTVYTVAMGSDSPPPCEHCGSITWVENDYAGEAARLKLFVNPHVVSAIIFCGPEHEYPGVYYAFGGYIHRHDIMSEDALYTTVEEAEESGKKWLEEERQELLKQIEER